MDREQLIREFHEMWDTFPGMARLITKKHEILASNEAAISKGFIPGEICAKVNTLQAHRGCLLAQTFLTGKGCFDRPSGHLIRGWLPVGDGKECVVHFSITLE